MKNSQLYIGSPNGIVLCADKKSGYDLKGRFYHSYSSQEVGFENTDQLVFEMEAFFDSICFPHPSTNMRSFAEEEKRECKFTEEQLSVRNVFRNKEKVMRDEELLSRHGDMGSFIVRVHNRQNSSMQGRLTWVEQNKTVCFRSAWEMVRLINSALDSQSPKEEEDLPSWED